jgi:hypothetical protein
VGQDNTTDRKTGSPTVTIASGTATFSEAQSGNIGVGDRVIYNTSSIAYISGKISQTQWTIVTATGGTPADVTNQPVDSIKREFASLFQAESEAADATHLNTLNLVTGNYVLHLPCYYDTGAVIVDNWTTDATRYIQIYTPNSTETEVNQSQRHQGRWDTARYNLSVDGYPLQLRDNYVRIVGLQMEETSAGARTPLQIVTTRATVANNILRTNLLGSNTGLSATATAAYNKIYNNIVISNSSGYIDISSTNGTGDYIFNNTFISLGNTAFLASKTGEPYPVHFKNNIIKGFSSIGAFDVASDSDYNSTDLPTYDWNIVGGGTGTHNRVSQTFTFTDAANDFHLVSADTGAKDAGINLSSDPDLPFSTDISGQVRPTSGPWDIGADEWSPSGKYTMSLWVKPATSIATKAIVGKAEELRLATNASGQPLCQIKSDGTWQTAATSSTAISVGEWSQVICAYDRVAMRVYVNGTLQGEQALTAAPDDTNSIFEIGHDASSGSTYGSYAGLVDSYRFFAYAMTDSQVKTEYNFGKSVRLGSTGTEAATGAPTNAASGDYCVPGDTSPCAPPVGEWTFNEKVAGDGKTLYDTSGNANNGTSNDGANNSGMDCSKPGKIGTACEFDGVDDLVQTPTGTIPPASCDYSISFWMKSNGTVSHMCEPVAWGYRSFVFYPGSGTRYLSYSPNGSWWAGARSTTNMDDSQWHFVVGTTSGGGSCTGVVLRIYVDGKLEGTATGNVNSSYYSMSIGAGPSGNFPGIVDNVRIYNYVRTPAQVAWEYNRGKPPAQWSFNETIGNTAHNKIADTLHGTRQNMEDADWVSGKIGNALDFDGSDEYVSIGDTNISLNAVSFWINADAVTDDILDLDGGTHTVTVSSGTIAANGFSSPTIYVDGEEGSAITTGNWHHVLIKTDTQFEASSLNIARIGSGYFDGKLDDIRLYNYPPHD